MKLTKIEQTTCPNRRSTALYDYSYSIGSLAVGGLATADTDEPITETVIPLVTATGRQTSVVVSREPAQPMPFQSDNRRNACGRRASLADFGLGTPVLHTASIVREDGGRSTHAFAAFLAVDEEDALRRLRARLGRNIGSATLRAGFDPSEPIAAELLSLPLVEILMDVDLDPSSPLAAGLEMYLEHHFR